MTDYSDYAGKTPFSCGSQSDFFRQIKRETQLQLVSVRIKNQQPVIPWESGENHKTVNNSQHQRFLKTKTQEKDGPGMDQPWGVLWDMDGTLVDTAKLHFDAWDLACREIGIEFTPEDFRLTFGRRNPEIYDYLFPGKPDPIANAKLGLDKELLYRAEARRQGIQLLPGVWDLMSQLHRVGALQAIGSSAPRGNLDLILELTGIGQFLGAVVGQEDTQRGKPDPEVFLRGAELLGVPPSACVVFEDAVAGIEAAKAGGMKAVGVTFVGHHSAESLKKAGADLIVSHLGEVQPSLLIDLVRSN